MQTMEFLSSYGISTDDFVNWDDDVKCVPWDGTEMVCDDYFAMLGFPDVMHCDILNISGDSCHDDPLECRIEYQVNEKQDMYNCDCSGNFFESECASYFKTSCVDHFEGEDCAPMMIAAGVPED